MGGAYVVYNTHTVVIYNTHTAESSLSGLSAAIISIVNIVSACMAWEGGNKGDECVYKHNKLN